MKDWWDHPLFIFACIIAFFLGLSIMVPANPRNGGNIYHYAPGTVVKIGLNVIVCDAK